MPSGKITTLEENNRTEISQGNTEGFWLQRCPWFAEVFARRASAVGRIFLGALYVLLFVCFIKGNSHFLPYFARLHRFRTCGKN